MTRLATRDLESRRHPSKEVKVSPRLTVTRATITRALIIGTVVIGAFGGGAIVDRAVIATPAWRELGSATWAAYSRHADLDNGFVVYPVYGIGLTVFTIAAAISYRLDRGAPRPAGPPIYLAALCALGVVATTIKAAPIMLGVPDLDTDSVALQNAFDRFTLWGVYVRGAFGTLALLAGIWALAAYPRARGVDVNDGPANVTVAPAYRDASGNR
jgi:hypothetical protein